MNKFFFALSLYCVAASSIAASFNCEKANTVNEKTICADSELSLLDEKLSEVYKKALNLNPDIKNWPKRLVEIFAYM